jgi:D-xylose transport system substrate-binding protein
MGRRATTWLAALAVAVIAVACGGSSGGDQAAPARARGLQIGFLMDTLHERWQRDRDLFIERAQYRDAHVMVEAAEGDRARQAQLADKLLAAGIKVLVLIPNDAEAAAEIVAKAKAQKVPVISYDRLVRNADVDLYVAFDSVKVGELQANYLLQRAPQGNYLLIGGSPSDMNAKSIRDGQLKVLGPAVKSGAVKIVDQPWADNWRADAAAAFTEAALKKTGNKLAAVVASNDQTAGGAIGVLEKNNLAGKVLVSGQDAELDAVRRIVAGTQTMTVYKPLDALAKMAADAAVRLAKGEAVDAATTVNNGKRDVPARLLDPLACDKSNLDGLLINDGFHTRDAIYGPGKPAGTK